MNFSIIPSTFSRSPPLSSVPSFKLPRIVEGENQYYIDLKISLSSFLIASLYGKYLADFGMNQGSSFF